jgi:hypothetical protein
MVERVQSARQRVHKTEPRGVDGSLVRPVVYDILGDVDEDPIRIG